MNGRSIQVAAVQMDVKPAPTDERLERAEQLVCDAVELGAELVVLPELFNTGYRYSQENFQRAESSDGPTLTWLKRAARRQHVHLAGGLLLREAGEIYNAMFIVAPDGRTWRYDKSYPFGWERGFFRENRATGAQRAVVARTDLGDLGMLVCWDVAHPELWQAYAGQVDLMVITSCPPQVTDLTLCLPDGSTLTGADLGPLIAGLRQDGVLAFGEMLDEQAAWLKVPAVNSVGCGLFESPIPSSAASLLALVPGRPALARFLPRAQHISMRAKMVDACKIVSAEGRPLARISQSCGEGFTIAEVPLAAHKPQPAGPQPATRLSTTAYLLADKLLPNLVKPGYQHAIKRLAR